MFPVLMSFILSLPSLQEWLLQVPWEARRVEVVGRFV